MNQPRTATDGRILRDNTPAGASLPKAAEPAAAASGEPTDKAADKPQEPGAPSPVAVVGDKPRERVTTLAGLLTPQKDGTPTWFMEELKRAIPSSILSPDRLARVTLTAMRRTPELVRCTPASFMGSLLQAAQLGLEVNTPLGYAWLIPRRDWSAEKWLRDNNDLAPGQEIWECTLMLGYQGMLALSDRSSRIKQITAMAVRFGDAFSHVYGTEQHLRWVPSEEADREKQPITHAWALAHLHGGGTPFVVLSRAKIEERRSKSAAKNNGPWVTHYEEMAQKSAIKALWKFLPKSAEMARADALETALEIESQQTAAWDSDVADRVSKAGLAHPTAGDASAA